jgi:hypothetical protein
MTVEININDNDVKKWLSVLNKYMNTYRGGYPLVHTIVGYIRNELDDYEQEKEK